MLMDTVTVNVGENNAIYVEIHSIDTPPEELRYGDVKYNDKDQMVVWYGRDNDDFSGWQISPFGKVGYTSLLIDQLTSDNGIARNNILRILNNDLDFNEETYLANRAAIMEIKDVK